MDHEYQERSRSYNRSLRKGDGARAIGELRLMARIRRNEDCPMDEMKLLITAFHLAAGGFAGHPVIERAVVAAAQANMRNGGVSAETVGQLYLDTIRDDTLPVMTITPHDGLYLFTLCINGRAEEAQELLYHFAVHTAE